MIPRLHRKTFLEQLPLIALLVITSVGLWGVYYLWAHPASQNTPVVVNGVSTPNPYFYATGELPDLDNCPAGPNARPCFDEFGIQISCYNPNQDDADFDRTGGICDASFDTPVPPPVCVDNDLDGYSADPDSAQRVSCTHPEQDCDDANPNRHPGALEPCGGSLDLNCDGVQPTACVVSCVDADSDGYSADPNAANRVSCTNQARDCNDGNLNVNPGKTEICSDLGNLDEDCSGFANCADFSCNSQLGPGGARCCWAGPTPGHLDTSQCVAANGEVCTTVPAGAACLITTETNCQDANDNDSDGPVDCADPDCAGQPGLGVTCCQGDLDCSGAGSYWYCDTTAHVCALSLYCGDGTVDRPNDAGINEQCEFDVAGITTLYGITTSDWGTVNYSAFQQSDGCVVCGSQSGGQACQTLNYRNCANLADAKPSLPPTKFAWVVNTYLSSGGSYVQSIAQIAALANVQKPGGGFYSIGDLANEYQVCKGSGVDPYYFNDYKTNGNCSGQIITSATNLAVNLEQNEVWVTYDYVAGYPTDFSGVALISDTLKKYCPTHSPLFFPYAVAVDQAGDAWVAGWNRANDWKVLRRYRRSTMASCAYQELKLTTDSASLMIMAGGKLNVAPNGDFWLLSNTSGSGIFRPYLLTYVPDLSAFAATAPSGALIPNVASLSLSSLQPHDILVETDSSVLVATNAQGLRKYRYNSGTKTVEADSGYNATTAAIKQDAVSFWPDPNNSGDLNTLWVADNDGANSTKLNGLNRLTGGLTFPIGLTYTSNTTDISAGSDGSVWSVNDGYGSFVRCSPPSGCDAAPYYTEHRHLAWNLVTGNDFLGLKRSITLGATVASALFYPAMDEGPLTAFDIPTGDPNAVWNHRWGKVMYTAGGSGSVQAYVCFSDNSSDTSDEGCPGGTGWVLAQDYNADFNNPLYRKKYLRLKVEKDLSATITDVKIGCTDVSGADVCSIP